MKIEEWVWNLFKQLEQTKFVKLDSYDVIEDPSYRQYFNLVNNLPWVALTDDNKAVSVDGKKIDYDKDVFMSVEEYIGWELQKLMKKVDDLVKAHPKLMECHMTIEVNGNTKKITRVLVLPQATSWDYMYDGKAVKLNW